MTLSRARFLTSASTTHHGASGMSVLANIASLARENSTHRGQLPAPGRVLQSRLEAPLLLGVADREPVLDQRDPAPDEHALELRARAEELHVLVVGAEPHDPFDPGAVVPGPVEQDHLPPGRQMGDVPLEVPQALLDVTGCRQGDDPGEPRVEHLGDALDRPALTCGVPALEDDDDAQATSADVLLLLDQLHLQPDELILVVDEVDLAGRTRHRSNGRLGRSGSGHDAEGRPAPTLRQPCPAWSMTDPDPRRDRQEAPSMRHASATRRPSDRDGTSLCWSAFSGSR